MMNENIFWFCHCCGLKNLQKDYKCKVCGRDQSYAQKGYTMPLHGAGAQIYRASQVSTVVDNILLADANGWTALHTSACNGNAALVNELLKMEANIIESVTECGQTALHLAAYSGSLETVETLIHYKANIHAATNFEKYQPIHIASERGWKSIVNFLLDNKANPNAFNAIDRTPLHLVAENGRVDIAVLLIRGGSNPKLLDAHGWNPRQVAELHGHRDIQELLIRATMTEKQPVIKELPSAPWHGELWSNLIATQSQKRMEYEKEIKREELKKIEIQKALGRK